MENHKLTLPSRRRFLRQASIAAGASLLLSRTSLWAQPPGLHLTKQEFYTAAAHEKIRTTQLRDGIYLLQGAGGNVICHTGSDGSLLIDCQFAAGAPHLLAAMAAFKAQPLKLLINTHWHFDHTDANAVMHQHGAFLIAHENCRARLASPQVIAFYGLTFPPAPAAAIPQQTFTRNETVFFNGVTHRLMHAPTAHTDTDIFIHFAERNVIHTGDLWFNGYYPLIDVSTGGTIQGMIDGVNRCLALADSDTKIVPGHGELGTRAQLVQYRDMLATVAARVRTLKGQGKSLQQTLAANPTADLDAVWGKGAMKGSALTTFAWQTI
jgi:glyoxylase-like metal-dependent hydrolase (beta-lactamase superfamily II)